MDKKTNLVIETEMQTITVDTGKIIDTFKFLDSFLNPVQSFPVLLRRKIVKAHRAIFPIYNDYEKIRIDLAKEASEGKMKEELDPNNPGKFRQAFDIPTDKLKGIEDELVKLRSVSEVIEVPFIKIEEFDKNPEVAPGIFIALDWLIVA
jgi:hypothetical protein